jgi:hypothetical protein
MKKVFVLGLIAVFIAFNAQAVEYYDDGQEHDISTPVNDSISIWNGEHHLPETYTTVNLQSGGTIYSADIYDQSIFNVFSDSETGDILSHHESHFNIFNGTVHHIELFDESHGIMSGGNVSEVYVSQDSRFSVSGGEIAGDIYMPGGIVTSDYGTAEISGGFVNQVLSLGNSTVEMSDGIVRQMTVGEYATANVTGGRIDELSLLENSQLVMTNVFADPMSPGGVTAYDSSHVSMTGGQGFISARGNSIVEVSNAIDVSLDIQDNAEVSVSDSEMRSLLPELRMNSSLSLTNTFIWENKNIQLFDTSRLTASMGTGLEIVELYNDSTFTLSGGHAYSVGAGGNSVVEISEGDVFELAGLEYGTIEISGGHIQTLRAIEACQVDITGGDISNLFADSSSMIVINGFDFNYGYGYITDSYGMLTGTLLSGEMINLNFERLGDAQILLVPEPATLLLFGLGGLVLRKRWKLPTI